MSVVRLWVSNRILLISDYDEERQEVFESVDGLVFAAPTTGGYIVTGIWGGRVDVTVRPLSSDPGPDGDEWEETHEVTMNCTHGMLIVEPLDSLEEREIASLASHGAGRYRVRCSAIGRSIAWQDVMEESEEKYLITSWPVQE